MLLFASGNCCPDTLTPAHTDLAASTLCHPSVNHHKVNLRLSAIVSRVGFRLSQKSKIILSGFIYPRSCLFSSVSCFIITSFVSMHLFFKHGATKSASCLFQHFEFFIKISVNGNLFPKWIVRGIQQAWHFQSVKRFSQKRIFLIIARDSALQDDKRLLIVTFLSCL